MVSDADTSNQVPEDHACPVCRERDADFLEWDKNHEWVLCHSCGAMYKPEGDHDEG